MKQGDRVSVREGRLQWTGKCLWIETPLFNSDKWAAITPDEYSIHACRGSGNREYHQNIIMIPLFLDKVEVLESA